VTIFPFIGLGGLLIYLLRYLDQETPKWPFRSSGLVATCYYQSNHSKVEAIPLLSTLPKDTTSELASLSSHYNLFNAERQTGKLW